MKGFGGGGLLAVFYTVYFVLLKNIYVETKNYGIDYSWAVSSIKCMPKC